MSYQDRLTSHLSDYKRSTLGIEQPGIYNYRGTDVLRDHILPIEHADLNLLPLARRLEPSFLARHPHVSRHRYFHHLTSSQAFAFNLFLPYFSRNGSGASALLRALGQASQLTSWELEAVPDVEEETNIDALWVTDDGRTTICEVKLSEAEFGRAENDARHNKKLEEIYGPLLRGHVHDGLLQSLAFFSVYQILRNVWHLLRVKDSRLVFLLPRENEILWRDLASVLERIEPAVRSRISTVAIEDVLRSLGSDPSCPEDLRLYAGELAAKYVLASA